MARKLKAIDWARADENIYDKTKNWFGVIGRELTNPEVFTENVYNMDETGVPLSRPSSLKMLVRTGSLRTNRGAGFKRTMVTAIECISAGGMALPPLVIWPASTHRSIWTTHPTPGWHFACSKNGYTNKHISLYWIKDVFDPLTRDHANGRPRILINDGFATHESLEIQEFCFQSNIILCRLPSHTSHKLQPLDVAIFGPLKTAYREQVEQLYRGGAGTVGKQHFTLLYSRARDVAFTRCNIEAAWEKTGLHPFNGDRVLNDIHRPQTEHEQVNTVSSQVVLPSAGDVQQTSVTSDGFATLRRLIEGEAKCFSDEGRHRLQKAFHAAERAMANRDLLKQENADLFEQNCEKQVRVSVKSTVVGSGKVMSYQDIVEAQQKRNRAPSKTQSPRSTFNKQQRPAPTETKDKHVRQAELQKAARDIDECEFQDYCHVLDL